MKINVGINGFGRIGTSVLRIMSECPDKFDVKGINLRNADLDQMIYALKYDSVHRGFRGVAETGKDCLIINGQKISVFSESDASFIPWSECGAEYIIESTGAYRTAEKASAHFNGGASKVIITAPAKDDVTPTFVYGVNEAFLKPEMKVVSNASCTTNCLAPLAFVINRAFGITEGLMSTIHAATARQNAVDSRGKDKRCGRSVFNNIIPTTTGAAKALGKVIPELSGKLTGISFRVPTPDVSVVDLTVKLESGASYAEVCNAVKTASETYMKNIIAYTSDPVVSSDITGNPCPCVFDETAGLSLNDRFIKLIAWYDNEWGYSSSAVRLLSRMAEISR